MRVIHDHSLRPGSTTIMNHAQSGLPSLVPRPPGALASVWERGYRAQLFVACKCIVLQVRKAGITGACMAS